MTNSTDSTPSAAWSNRALLEAYESADAGSKPAVADLIVSRLAETVSDHKHGPRAFLIMTDWGTWGRGKTLAAAAGKAVEAGAPRKAKAVAFLALNDDSPSVSSDGMVWAGAKSTLISLGAIGTLSSVISAAKIGGAS